MTFSSRTTPNDPTRIDGCTAVVTGASSGIGRAIALELAAAGADVAVHFRGNEVGANEVVGMIRDAGRDATAMQFDLTHADQQDRLARDAWQWKDRVDIWVNNAGVDVLTGPAVNWSFDEKFEKLWRVDVAATIRLSREIGQRMRQQSADRQGVLLNMGWDQAEHGMAGDSGEMFGAVKGAVMAFTRSLAKTLAPRVRVNCLAPGWIKTSWGEHASEFWQDIASKQSLLARWGTPEDVARVARFLVSPAAGFITGQVIPVNGGFNSGV